MKGSGVGYKAGLELILIRSIWLFLYIGVLVVGVLTIRALLLGVYIRALDFWGLRYKPLEPGYWGFSGLIGKTWLPFPRL